MYFPLQHSLGIVMSDNEADGNTKEEIENKDMDMQSLTMLY